MKKCTEITELLSAYADNELTGSDKRSVEEHLAACENCSALLEIYREISISVDESSAPVPDALRIGVMNRVRSERISNETVKDTNKKKWWQHQVLLTRLAPIAACLAVVLLIWQYGGNMFSMNEYASPANVPAPAAMPDAPAASAGDSAVGSPEALETFVEYEWSTDDAIYDEDMMSMPEEASDGLQPQATSEPLPAFNRRTDGAESELIDPEGFAEFINQAYAEITFTGELPAILADLEPLPIYDWDGWELIFEIPSTDIDTLIEQLIDRTDVSLTHNHNNSTYAIVFYSRG